MLKVSIKFVNNKVFNKYLWQRSRSAIRHTCICWRAKNW